MENILQLFLALILGGIVGLEREYKRKEAGVKTYSLVSLGACLFTIVALQLSSQFSPLPNFRIDITRIIQAIAVGVGFIGAGVILHKENRVEGLTTAAGLWVVAGIGVLVGIKFYLLALFTAFLTLGVLSGVGFFEQKVFRKE